MASGAPLSSLSSASLAGLINDVPVELNGVAPIAPRGSRPRAGYGVDKLDVAFMIRRLPGSSPPARCFLEAPARRLFAAGLVRDRRRGGKRRVEIFGS